jgi:hypothetical protein
VLADATLPESAALSAANEFKIDAIDVTMSLPVVATAVEAAADLASDNTFAIDVTAEL